MLSIVFFNLFLTSCKDEEIYPIPSVPVNIYLNLDLPAYQPLNVTGGWVYVNGGSKGIIVYRNFDEFIALDRHTTHEPDEECSIATVDSTNFFILNDGCSESKYSMLDGTVVQGPAKWGLRKYFADWDGFKALYIYN